MSSTVYWSDTMDVPNVLGTYNFSFDVGTNPKYIGLFVTNMENQGGWSVTVGGQSITTRLLHGELLGTDVTFWHLIAPSAMSGLQTVSFVRSGLSEAFDAVMFSVESESPVSVLDSGSGGAAGTMPGIAVDTGATAGTGIFACTYQTPTPYSGQTNVTPSGWPGTISIEDAPTSGARTLGGPSNGTNAAVALVLSTGAMVAELSPFTLSPLVTAPTVDAGSIHAYFEAIRLSPVVAEPRVVVRPQRVLATVGVHSDTPGRVAPPSGLVLPVLVYQNGEPTWVEAETIYGPHRRIVMRPGITDPPEPVANVDGDDYVYMEYDD